MFMQEYEYLNMNRSMKESMNALLNMSMLKNMSANMNLKMDMIMNMMTSLPLIIKKYACQNGAWGVLTAWI